MHDGDDGGRLSFYQVARSIGTGREMLIVPIRINAGTGVGVVHAACSRRASQISRSAELRPWQQAMQMPSLSSADALNTLLVERSVERLG